MNFNALKRDLDAAVAARERVDAEIIHLDQQQRVAEAKGDRAAVDALGRNIEEAQSRQRDRINDVNAIRRAMGLSEYG